MAAKKTKKRWDKKDLAKKQAAKQPLALEAAADQPAHDLHYTVGYGAREDGAGSHECPHTGVENYEKRLSWLNGWNDANNGLAHRPAGNKGGTVTREAVRE